MSAGLNGKRKIETISSPLSNESGSANFWRKMVKQLCSVMEESHIIK